MAMVAVLFLVLLTAPAAFAAVHTVGGNSGWTQGVNYTTWAAGETFTVGDTLVFTYGGSHKVDVVNKAGYDNCDSSSPISSNGGGNTSIPLPTAGAMYFLCPTPGHCDSGMKLSINVVAATPGTPPSPTPPSSTPPPSGTPPSSASPPSSGNPSPPPPPTKTDNSNSGVAVSSGFGYLVLVLGALLAYMV